MDSAKLKNLEPGSDQEKKLIYFRENRLQIPEKFNGTAEIRFGDSQRLMAKILNLSRFGARILVTDNEFDIHSGDWNYESKFKVKDICVYSGKVSFVNEQKLEEGAIAVGVAFAGQGLDPDQISAIIEMEVGLEGLSSSKKLLEISTLIRPEFKILVADLNTLFQDLKLKLTEEQFRIDEIAKTENQRRRLEEHAINLALSLYNEDIHLIFSKFKLITDELNFDETIIHKRYFRSNFHPLVIGAPFVSRGFKKPLGYAGDYGLMVMLYDYSDDGQNLFEKFFHRFSCNEPAAIANKNRVDFLADMLLEKYNNTIDISNSPFKVSTLACGPAKEIELFLSECERGNDQSVSIICVDREDKALEYVQRQLKPFANKHTKISLFKEDVILSLIKGREVANEVEKSDVIISAGLFDYLSDRVASKMIECMYGLLAPGGMLIIGNVSENNPDKFSMDYFAEWNLILRSLSDLEKLVPEHIAKTPGVKLEVTSESLGINLFLRLTKPHGR